MTNKPKTVTSWDLKQTLGPHHSRGRWYVEEAAQHAGREWFPISSLNVAEEDDAKGGTLWGWNQEPCGVMDRGTTYWEQNWSKYTLLPRSEVQVNVCLTRWISEFLRISDYPVPPILPLSEWEDLLRLSTSCFTLHSVYVSCWGWGRVDNLNLQKESSPDLIWRLSQYRDLVYHGTSHRDGIFELFPLGMEVYLEYERKRSESL